MTPRIRATMGWWGLALAVAAAARWSPVPGIGAALAVGLVIGSIYVWLLDRRVRAAAEMTPQRALVAAQVGGMARLAFVVLALIVAARLWPHSVGPALLWSAPAFFVPVVVWMVSLLRGVKG